MPELSPARRILAEAIPAMHAAHAVVATLKRAIQQYGAATSKPELAARLVLAKDALKFTRIRVDQAAQDVLRDEVAARRDSIVGAYEAAMKAAAEVQGDVEWLAFMGALDRPPDVSRARDEARWRRAFARLKRDAAAPLPG